MKDDLGPSGDAGGALKSLYALDPVWDIRPEAMHEVCWLWEWLHSVGDGRVDGDLEAAIGQSEEPVVRAARERRTQQRVEGAVAVLPIHGPIFHRPNLYTRWGFGVSSEEFGRMFDQMAANEDVGAIVLDIDSPGGMHAGTEDLANRIYRARKADRPIIAVSNDLMASAAYWIGSSADEIVVSPGSLTGSIGTILMHVEMSKALESMGITVNVIHAGEFKKEGNPYEPLTDEGRAHLQSLVDAAYADFRNGVARNRGADIKTVESDFGQGRVYGEGEAIKRGMADREATLEGVLLRLGVKNPGKRQAIDASAESRSRRHDLARRRAELGV